MRQYYTIMATGMLDLLGQVNADMKRAQLHDRNARVIQIVTIAENRDLLNEYAAIIEEITDE